MPDRSPPETPSPPLLFLDSLHPEVRGFLEDRAAAGEFAIILNEGRYAVKYADITAYSAAGSEDE